MNTPISLNDFNIQREDFNKICRICLSRNASENIFKLTYSNVLLIQLYEILCGIRIRNTDNLPQNICKDCIARLVRYYDFQIKCQKIEDYLRTLLVQENGEQSEETVCIDEEDLQSNSVYFVKRLNFDCDNRKNTVKIGETVFLSDLNESIPQLIDDGVQEDSDNIIISHTETVIDDNCNVPEYLCSCRESFTNLSDLFEHCSSLGHEAKIDQLDDHQNEIKHNAPIYYCIYCNNFYYDEKQLLEHLNLNHQFDGFSCKLCSSKFLSLENVKKHAAVHDGEIPYHCMECLEGFTEISQYKSHGFTHKPVCLVCEYCGNDYRNERKYRSHIRLKHSQNNHEQHRYLCDICGKSFATPQALYQHRSNLHSNNIYICDRCHRRFPTKLLLNRHCLIHTDVKQYQCKVCQKSFRHQPSLRSHLLLHIGKRPYACKMCPRRFTQSAHLRTHSFVHTGEKPYVCRYCDRKFALSGNLTTHVRLHTGERPYRCDDCGKDFIALNPLKKHRLTHGNRE